MRDDIRSRIDELVAELAETTQREDGELRIP